MALNTPSKLRMTRRRTHRVSVGVVAFQALSVFGDAFVDVGVEPNGGAVKAHVMAVGAAGQGGQP